MGTLEIIRIALGIALILFGLGVYAYDTLHDMKYSEFRYSPISWVFAVGAGVIVSAYNIKIGIIMGIISIILWILEKIVLSKVIMHNK